MSNIDYSGSDAEGEDLPANILTIKDCEDIYDTRQLNLRDLYFVDKQGFVKWTIAITRLKPGQQTRGHRHNDSQEMCRIEKGEGFLVLDGIAHRVKAGTYAMIPVQVHHKLINISGTEELVAIHDIPIHLVRAGHVRGKH